MRLTNATGYSWNPSISVSGSSIHVVLYDLRDVFEEIYYKRSTDGGTTWGPDTRLTYDPAVSEYPSVSVSGLSIHVVWYDWRDGILEIYYKRSTDGGTTWGPDTRLTYANTDSRFPSVSASDKFVHIVWQTTQGGGLNIFYKRSTDGGINWEPDIRLTNNTIYEIRFPSVSASDSSVHVVWYDSRDANYEIYYKRNARGNTGVEEEKYQTSKIKLQSSNFKTTPNPFSSFTKIYGFEKEKFVVYDLTGKIVGIYNGERIGDDLPAGIYFIKSFKNDSKYMRILKVR